MRLAELARSPWILAGVALVGLVARRPHHREAAMPIVDVPAPHELTMTVDDCASDVELVGGKYVVTLRLPDAARCTSAVRVYHLENDRLVFERHD
jgi:hypothetical protein